MRLIARSGLFERRRRLMDDWAAYLAGERRDPEAQRVGDPPRSQRRRTSPSGAEERGRQGWLLTPLAVMSQPTLWGHASRVPGRGWRGWLRPLRSPGRPRSGRPWRARGRQVARIGGNLNHLGAVSGLVERRRRPHWDDLPSHLAGEKLRPAAGFVDTPRSQRRLMAFPAIARRFASVVVIELTNFAGQIPAD